MIIDSRLNAVQFIEHYIGAISLSFAVIVTTTATGWTNGRREYVGRRIKRQSGVFVIGWLRALQICQLANTMGNKPLCQFHYSSRITRTPRLSVSSALNSSRCESFSFLRIGAITSDFASQHWVMNAECCAVLFASVLPGCCVLYLSVYHDYIILRAIRLARRYSVNKKAQKRSTLIRYTDTNTIPPKKNKLKIQM